MLTEMARVKTAITLDKKFLDWIDEKIKEGVYSSRSHAIRYALIQLMKKKEQRE